MKTKTNKNQAVPRAPHYIKKEETDSLQEALESDRYLYDAFYKKEELSVTCFEDYHFNGCCFQDIRCTLAQFTGNEFLDCMFIHCDFSTVDLSHSHFYRCRFESCRFSGTAFYDCLWKDVAWDGCMMQYANFGGSSFERCQFQSCSLKEGGFIQCQQKKLTFEHCDLQYCSFANCSLSDIHLESNEIEGIIVNEDSLRGVYVSPQQAVILASLLGIHVQEE